MTHISPQVQGRVSHLSRAVMADKRTRSSLCNTAPCNLTVFGAPSLSSKWSITCIHTIYFIPYRKQNTARARAVGKTCIGLRAEWGVTYSNFTNSDSLLFNLPTCQPARKYKSLRHSFPTCTHTYTHTQTFQSTCSHKTHNIYLNPTKEPVYGKYIRILHHLISWCTVFLSRLQSPSAVYI